MTERDLHYALEPVRLFSSPKLLSGGDPGALPSQAEVITDLDQAMILENNHDLPVGYRIWSDVIANAQSEHYTRPEAKEGEKIVEALALQAESYLDDLTETAPDTEILQFWETVADDILEQLKSVAVSRFVLGVQTPSVFEDIQQSYRAGFYPCGQRADGAIVVFDPKGLGGFDLIPRPIA